jgi:geranylgeranyl pyrophosphate synthase
MALPGLKRQLDTRLAQAELPGPLLEQASAVLAKVLGHYERFPLWPVPELPERTALALGLRPEIAEGLTAASVLFYAASDIIDDAQDDELGTHATWPAWGWQHAVNTGNLLLFLSGEHLAGIEAKASVKAAWHAAFARAGRQLSRGQFRDFLATSDAPWGETEIMRVLEDKAGASFGCLASLAALGAERDDWRDWEAFGRSLGLVYQLASDIRPYMGFGTSRDVAIGKLTLPLLAAREVDPTITQAWADGAVLRPIKQEGLKARVAATGAVTYACMRVEVLKKEAHDRLARLDCPSAQALLAPLVDLVVLDRPAGSGA